MNVPTDRKYSETHEWCLVEADIVTVGLTQFAADELTDITFVELPEVGTHLSSGDTLAEVESVKATAEVLTAVAGTVIEINTALTDQPELVNSSAFEEGWLARLRADSLGPLESLLDHKGYESLVGALG